MRSIHRQYAGSDERATTGSSNAGFRTLIGKLLRTDVVCPDGFAKGLVSEAANAVLGPPGTHQDAAGSTAHLGGYFKAYS